MVATHVAPAVVPHPVTGQPVWFNLCHLPAPGWTEYADGTPIEPGRWRQDTCCDRLVIMAGSLTLTPTVAVFCKYENWQKQPI
jgi:hypothetical protein